MDSGVRIESLIAPIDSFDTLLVIPGPRKRSPETRAANDSGKSGQRPASFLTN